MSIQSGLGNLGSDIGNTVQGGLSWASGRVGSIFGTITTGLGNIWDGGFAGISKEQLESTLIPALQSYCERIEESINAFNAEADVTASFAGAELVPNVQEFIGAVKQLLQAYVSTMRQEIATANSAYEQYQIGSQNVAAGVSSSASEIRSAAQSIRID